MIHVYSIGIAIFVADSSLISLLIFYLFATNNNNCYKIYDSLAFNVLNFFYQLLIKQTIRKLERNLDFKVLILQLFCDCNSITAILALYIRHQSSLFTYDIIEDKNNNISSPYYD